MINPKTPVLVGSGQITQKVENFEDAKNSQVVELPYSEHESYTSLVRWSYNIVQSVSIFD